ncbi:ubiquitin-specific protease ubp1 [Neocucurbitaria cava]|uniref:ubiquitinyl hydrolase 1 n=1 Tax=Neocucurbitaria cava TaxID=798079 RepID=A0A9W8XZY5_9PLEO|nr:ubiquitin-specific protease ubp1 [Neocucurbitaria cava]
MSYEGHPEFEAYQQRWTVPESTPTTTAIFLAVVVGAYVVFKSLDLLGYPVWLWTRRLTHIAGDVLGGRGASLEPPDSDSSDATMNGTGGLLGSLFGLNPGNLLRKGVRGVTGALSMGPSDVPPGLGNLSNSCYQNSVIQGLASLPSLHNYLSKTITEHPSLTTETTNGALYEMISKLNDAGSHGQHFWVRGKLKSMSTFQQQDAQEYYSKVLDALDEEVKKAGRSKRRSSVSLLEATKGLIDLPETGKYKKAKETDGTETNQAPAEQPKIVPNPLDGLLAQRVGCVSCGYSEGLSLIPFNCITVSLGRNYGYDIRECLDDYTTLEYIDGVECAKCTLLKMKKTLTPLAAGKPGSPFELKLNAVQEALDDEDFEDKTLIKKLNVAKKNWVQSTKSKQAVVARAPKSLVLHVNRSSFNEMTGMSYKNTAGVSYPMVLDLGNWCLGNTPSGSQHPDMSMEEWPRDPKASMLPESESEPVTTSPFQYRLRAAVTHYGSHGNGHYVCYRPHPKVASPTPGIDGDSDEAKKEDLPEERWWRFSDDSVYAVSEQEAHQGNVFMLFYERMDEPTTSPPQELDTAVESIPMAEDAPLPPAELSVGTTSITNDEAVEIPLPDDEDLFDLMPPESSVLPTTEAASSGQPLAEDDKPPTVSVYPTPPPEDQMFEPDSETEMSEADSEDAPSTQVTSENESEADIPRLPTPPTPKALPIPTVSPHLMRTAGNAASRGQGSNGSRQSLPLVSAT